nr:Histidyl-tRNA synthetase [uncultured bacterium]
MKYLTNTKQASAKAGMAAQLPSREMPVDQPSIITQTCEEKLLLLKQALQNMEMSWLSLAEQNQILRTMQLWGIANSSEMHHSLS